MSAGFSLRYGGCSRSPYDALNLGDAVGDHPDSVAANRRAVAVALGAQPDALSWMRQVHGSRVVDVDRPDRAGSPEGDAQVTALPGLVLAVLVADCVPVLFADARAGLLAVAHAGRRGLQLGVVPATIRALTARGADPARIRVALGPSVGPCCYEVPAAMRDEVADAAPGSASNTRAGTPSIDLRAGLRGQLRRVDVEYVVDVGGCTAQDRTWFSHRRDGVTGRFAGLVVRR